MVAWSDRINQSDKMRHSGALPSRLLELARRAGHAIQAIYEQHDTLSNSALVAVKSDESPLTLADLASHNLICAGLRELTPHIPIVSEEDVSSLANGTCEGEFWLIDPLDGTKEFLARNGEFTVNIALIRAGAPVWGVVFAPALDLLYWGGNELGAYRQYASIITEIRVAPPVSNGARYRVVASKSHLNQETSDFIARLQDADLIQAGSSLKFCRVAEGAADVYPRLAPTCEWDTAAAQAVVEGAGGFVCDLSGERLRYGKGDILNPHFVVSTVPLAVLGR